MKRSFLSRRLSRLPRNVSRRFTRVRSRKHPRKHPRYHHSMTRRQTRRIRNKKRGGAIGETVATVNGIPVGRNVVVTNEKGVTRSLEAHNPMTNADTAGEFGDDI